MLMMMMKKCLTRAKMFLQTNRTQAAEIDLDLQTHAIEGPITSSVWICRISVQRFRRYPPKIPVLSLVSLTFDLQTHPCEGPNTSSVWIWRKSVQQFPRYFMHKLKKSQHQKQNLMQFTACGNQQNTVSFFLSSAIHKLNQPLPTCRLVSSWTGSTCGWRC